MSLYIGWMVHAWGGCGDMSSCAILRGHYGTKN
jgi:hypothetical protein